MTTEAPVNPNQVTGLTPEQQQTAVELRQNIGEKATALAEHVDATQQYIRYGIGDKENPQRAKAGMMIQNDVVKVVKKLQLKSAKRAAAKHYEQNESAYQEQARQEAEADGVEINS